MRRRRKGKRIDTVYYSPDGAAQSRTIEVRMDVDGYGHRTFLAHCDDLDVEVKGTDLNQVIEDAKKAVVQATKTVWEDKLRVRVSGTDDSGYRTDTSTDLMIGYQKIRVCQTDEGVRWTDDPDTKRPYINRYDPEQSGDDDQYVCIPNTPENVERLESIITALRALRGRVFDLLGKKKILKTLTSPNLLLPPAKE